MNSRKQHREELGLSQTDAAALAKRSLATWRRWEEDPDSVSDKTRAACEKVLSETEPLFLIDEDLANKFETAWRDCYHLTPRQAYALASTLNWWADMTIAGWLNNPSEEPLHEIEPFSSLDIRVMIIVNENRAWAAAARDRCAAVAEEIEKGVLPFDRPGCFFDELLMALAVPFAQTMLEEETEAFYPLPARQAHDYGDEEEDLDEEYPIGDTEWDAVIDSFDDQSRWDEWDVPAINGYAVLPLILADHHPYSWFDVADGSGPGYLQRLVDLTVDKPE